MIQINLLPEELREKPEKKTALHLPAQLQFLKRFSTRALLIAGGTAAGIMLLLILVATVFFPTASLQSKIHKMAEQSARIKKDVEMAQALEKEEEELKKVVATLAGLQEKRIPTAWILNDVSDAAPDEIQLTKLYIKVEEQKVEKKAAAKAPKKKRGEPKEGETKESEKKKEKKKKVVAEKKTKRFLMLEGILLGKSDEQAVYHFLENLRKTKTFGLYFSEISLAAVAVREDGTKEFSIRCQFMEKKA